VEKIPKYSTKQCTITVETYSLRQLVLTTAALLELKPEFEITWFEACRSEKLANGVQNLPFKLMLDDPDAQKS